MHKNHFETSTKIILKPQKGVVRLFSFIDTYCAKNGWILRYLGTDVSLDETECCMEESN